MVVDRMTLETLLSPMQFAFMQSAFVAAFLLAVPAALLSCFLILRGWALMGDGISHAVLPGIAIAWALALPLALGAFLAGLACAVLTGFIAENSRVKRDTVLGVVFSAMFAMGIVLIVWLKPDVHLDHILFGNILGLNTADLVQMSIIAAIILVMLACFGRDLTLLAFDEVQAGALGLNTRLLHYLLLVLVTAIVVAALSAVGIILAIALLVAPGATGLLVARQLSHMMLVAVCTCLFSAIAGVYLSFFIDSAPAPTMVLFMTAFFVIAFLLRNRMRPIAAPPAVTA
jgi:manganese/iron transport system permease protein